LVSRGAKSRLVSRGVKFRFDFRGASKGINPWFALLRKAPNPGLVSRGAKAVWFQEEFTGFGFKRAKSSFVLFKRSLTRFTVVSKAVHHGFVSRGVKRGLVSKKPKLVQGLNPFETEPSLKQNLCWLVLKPNQVWLVLKPNQVWLFLKKKTNRLWLVSF